MKETWKVVEGFNNYVVSNTGKVISFHRSKPKVLKTDMSRKYPCVTLCNNTTIRRVFVHILVAEHFLDKVEGKHQINHIDGNKMNPSLDNLEWCTQSENQLHAYRTGLQEPGEKMYGAKRTEDQVKEVCALIEKGLKRKEILDQCPYMSKAIFDNIRSRRRWVHVSKNYEW